LGRLADEILASVILKEEKMTIAVLFPGQGSQKSGMLSDVYAEFENFRKTIEEASHALGYDLWELIQSPENEEKLNQTEYTQPAILAVSVGLFRLLPDAFSAKISYMAGHSLGEYSALVCAGSLKFTDALKLVAQRGRFMQDAVKPGEGAMAAILGLSDDLVIQACKESGLGEIVSAVNFNCPGQVVIAGHLNAVNRACEKAKGLGAKRAQMLSVSVPSHCQLMESAALKLSEALLHTEVRSPLVHVIHNVDVKMHSSGDDIRQALCGQLSQPVRWTETIKYCESLGVNAFFECGPGKVLSALNKRIVDCPIESISSLESLLILKGQAY
jgi:[acyl-carrier-protein] S-malonyltransferase